MTLTIALAPWTTAASATALVRFTTAVVTRFQQGIAIVMAISLTSWAYVAVHAPQTPMAMGYVMTLTTALALDACGICNGPGAIYDCGCEAIPAGDCDCDGNQLDVLGVCGGSCSSDADGDGVCDDVDDCVGSYDACGICNGPGAIYDCGLTRFQREIAIVMAINQTPWACVADFAPQTSMAMGCVMTLTTALAPSMNADLQRSWCDLRLRL